MFGTLVVACLLSQNQATLAGKLEIPGNSSDLSGLSRRLNDGSPANLLGGLGSALSSGSKAGEYYLLPDRGPGDGAADYPCRWHQALLSLSPAGIPQFSLKKTTLLQDADGRGYQGLSADLKNRLDPEGLRVGPWPGCDAKRRSRIGEAFYVAEEYQPGVSVFQQDGTLAFQLPTPEKFLVTQPNRDADTELAQNKSGRQPNKGFEGLAIDPEGHELWAATQGPLIQDKKAGGGKWCRLVRYNLDSGKVDGEFIYPLDSPTCGISEILWVGPGRLLVLERDSFAGREAKFKRIYLAKLGRAQDVSPLTSLYMVREPLQIMGKKLVVDLLEPRLGLAGDRLPPKWEGMAWGDVQQGDPLLWLISDNDFMAKNNTWVLALKIPAVMLRD